MYGEDMAVVTFKIPISLKRKLEDLFPSSMSEFIRNAVEKELANYESSIKDRLLKEKEDLLRRIREIDELLNQIDRPVDITDQERMDIIERFSHIVKAIKGDNSWRAELPPEEAAKHMFRSYVEDSGLDTLTAKKKVLRVFPELEGVI
jgi:Arc/MetJ-type ribon-helix-helix transcriptional regulator